MNRSTWIHRFILASLMIIMTSGVSSYVLAESDDGLYSYSIGEFEKAEAIFSEILKGDAENVQAAYYLGLSLLMQKKYQESLGILKNLEANIDNKAVMKKTEIPTEGQVKIGLARAYLGLKKYPEALDMLNGAEAKADSIDIHTYKGAYYLEINENNRAKDELEKALNLNSQNPYTFYYAGVCFLRLGDPQKAVKFFKEFLNMAPYAPEAERTKFLIDTLC